MARRSSTRMLWVTSKCGASNKVPHSRAKAILGWIFNKAYSPSPQRSASRPPAGGSCGMCVSRPMRQTPVSSMRKSRTSPRSLRMRTWSGGPGVQDHFDNCPRLLVLVHLLGSTRIAESIEVALGGSRDTVGGHVQHDFGLLRKPSAESKPYCRSWRSIDSAVSDQRSDRPGRFLPRSRSEPASLISRVSLALPTLFSWPAPAAITESAPPSPSRYRHPPLPRMRRPRRARAAARR